MKKKLYVIIIVALTILSIFLCGMLLSMSRQSRDGKQENTAYSNPIDSYFMPHIEMPEAEIERREYQDAYAQAWHTEYENIIGWMLDKCTYQEDRDKILEYDAKVQETIVVATSVLITDWLGDYELSPDSPDRNSWGNGTRSALNETIGTIYRNAGMLLIKSGDYTFLQQDYNDFLQK